MKRTVLFIIMLCGSIGSLSAFAGEYVDPPFTGMPPTVARGMHACDEGHVMTGVHAGSNQFLCMSPWLGGNQDDAKSRVIDTGTQRNVGGTQMHVCPTGMVMKGLELSRNLLLCETAGIDERTVFGDTGTVRAGMHACPTGTVMKGMHAGLNILACVNLGPY